MKSIKKGFLQGIGLALGVLCSALLAVTVSGTINEFSVGEALSASKINENFASLKSAIESIPTESYSTTETLTSATWIDGSPIYRKLVLISMNGSAGTTYVAHNITDYTRIINYYTVINNGGMSNATKLPFPNANGSTNAIAISIETTQIAIIETGIPFSGYSGYAVIEYTK